MDYCDEHKERLSVSGQNCRNIDDIKSILATDVFPELREIENKKVSMNLFWSFITLAVIVLGGSFSILYNQGMSTQSSLNALSKELAATNRVLTIQGANQKNLIDNFGDWKTYAPPPHSHMTDGRIIKGR